MPAELKGGVAGSVIKGAMRQSDLWSSLILLLLGAAISYESLNLGIGIWTVPGPGFSPFGAGLSLACVAIGIFISAIVKGGKAPDRPEKFWPRPESRKVVFLVFMSLIVYNIIWTKLGFSLTTFLFVGFLFVIVGKRRWWVVITGAVLTSFIAYLIFQYFLQSQLPTGIVGF